MIHSILQDTTLYCTCKVYTPFSCTVRSRSVCGLMCGCTYTYVITVHVHCTAYNYVSLLQAYVHVIPCTGWFSPHARECVLHVLCAVQYGGGWFLSPCSLNVLHSMGNCILVCVCCRLSLDVTGFNQQATGAVLDLTADDDEGLAKNKGRKKW